ncbi:MAG: dihydroorotate dehydrogenase [Phycisphaerales bacterium]|nr:dihydroorotate dehydrogenase [Phycisphaerales bacterium]
MATPQTTRSSTGSTSESRPSSGPPGAPAPAAVDLRVSVAGVEMRNPMLTASGTCGYGPEYEGNVDYSRLGGFTTKSVTLHERPGNEPQRIVEVRAGILNAIGLANVGLKRFLAEKVPFIRTMDTRVFVNVAGYKVEDYVEVCAALDEVDCLAGIELNVSCPNVSDGLMFGTSPDLLRRLIEAVRGSMKKKPLIVKLSPNVTDIATMARAAVDGGAQGLSLINTYVGLAIDAKAWRPMLANVTGGLSGPAIKPLALFNVHRVYREVARKHNIPIIGMGGVQNTTDAVEFLLAGASAVAVGTALFVDPTLPIKIADGLAAYLAQRGLTNVGQLVGQLRLPGEAAPQCTSP